MNLKIAKNKVAFVIAVVGVATEVALYVHFKSKNQKKI